MTQIFDGFWLPKQIKEQLITPETEWVVQYHASGVPADLNNPDAVGARWPLLTPTQWELLFEYLEDQRIEMPPDIFDRLQSAIESLLHQFMASENLVSQEFFQILKTYTGYSPEMIRFAMSSFEKSPLEDLGKLLAVEFPKTVERKFISLRDLGGPDGSIKFFKDRGLFRFPLLGKASSDYLQFEENYPKMVLGYASGNVAGTAFIITLLAQVSALVIGKHPDHSNRRLPAILVKNSRQEPMFVPFLFTALEQIDPTLLNNVAIMIWDYEDTDLQDRIVSHADLVLAAAGDHTIAQIESVIKREKPSVRFHKHGHKVSFTTIGRSYLEKDSQGIQSSSSSLLEDIALLAGIDSVLWDQNGCLSSRIHFIERGPDRYYTAIDYGNELANKLRILSRNLPRGNVPMSRIHDRFDHFSAQTLSSDVQLCSTYDDDFIVVVDNRPWDQQQFASIINSCIERTITIRTINSILEVPNNYFTWISKNNLQTMYVAIDDQTQQIWSKEFSEFVEEIGKRGITSIRTIGQSALPQLAYSWDGYMPHNLSLSYPKGYFSTVEFDNTYPQINRTLQWLTEKLPDIDPSTSPILLRDK